ncbi:AtpZ/AtpI family protein [Lebetimonas natsushimae]|nr:AtpZ/AtpI family protein [Lebetimonas natsushimae]
MRKTVEGAEKLSLGISIVVAVLMGIGIGIWLKNIFHQNWLLWLGVFWGVAAALLNIKKEYDKLKKDLDSLKDNPEFKNYQMNKKTKEEDDDLEEFEK